MRSKSLEFLRCPHCFGTLSLDTLSREEEHIVDGVLICACERWYPVIKGVARMLPDALRMKTLRRLYPYFFGMYQGQLPKILHDGNDPHQQVKQKTLRGFGYEWKNFRRLYPEYTKQFLDWIFPVKPEFFKNKLVLDAGCGTGRHARAAASFGARVFAIDLSDAVDVAHEHTKKSSVEVVQADLYHLPFLPEMFDYGYCIGVLHHLPSPDEGFARLVSMIKKGGHVSIWVYGKENNWTLLLVNPLRTCVFSKLPLQVTYWIALGVGMIVFPLAQGYQVIQRACLPRRVTRFFPQYHFLSYLAQFPFVVCHSIIFDQLLAPVAFYHTKQEVVKWFADAGIKNPIITWRNHNSWRGFGKKERKSL